MRTFLHSFAGTIAGIVVIVLIVGVVGSCVAGRKSKIEDSSYLMVELYGELPEYDPPGNIMGRILGQDGETLQRVLSNLRKARVDDRIDGVILKVDAGSSLGRAEAEEIRLAVRRLQEAGKAVPCYAQSFSETQYYLLAACDEIISPPTAFITFDGFMRGSIHIKGALAKLGIKADISKIKDYKSAAELVTREDMSEPAKENAEWMLDEFWNSFTETLAADRNLSEEQVIAAMERATFRAHEALERGFIDTMAYWDEVETRLKGEDDEKLRTVSQKRYAQVEPADLDLEGDRTIAVVHAQGMIGGRKSGVHPLFGITMGHESVIADLRRARDDEDVAAIVFRVDSPGGVSLDSDLIGHEVELIKEVKPVVVSMVDVAASGGYEISYRASKMLADSLTITGSIGSISGKFNVREMWGKLGVTVDAVTKGPNALMFSSFSDFTPEQRARFQEDHWEGFNYWLEDVAKFRGMTFEEAEALAHGRVFTGRQAVENGLIDEVGDLHRAIEVAKELAEVPADEEVTLVHYPEKKSLFQLITGDDGEEGAAARWAVYRQLRTELSTTWDMIEQNPDLAAEVLAP